MSFNKFITLTTYVKKNYKTLKLYSYNFLTSTCHIKTSNTSTEACFDSLYEVKKIHDKNFAIHFPFIDKIFGTYHLPSDEWPEEMGLEDESFPKGYLRQQIYPFFTDPKSSTPTNQSLR